MPKDTSLQPSIIRRLDAAIEDMKVEGFKPSGLYLTGPDWIALNLASSKTWGHPVITFAWRNVQVFARHLAPGNVPERYSVIAAPGGIARRILQRGGRSDAK